MHPWFRIPIHRIDFIANERSISLGGKNVDCMFRDFIFTKAMHDTRLIIELRLMRSNGTEWTKLLDQCSVQKSAYSRNLKSPLTCTRLIGSTNPRLRCYPLSLNQLHSLWLIDRSLMLPKRWNQSPCHFRCTSRSFSWWLKLIEICAWHID